MYHASRRPRGVQLKAPAELAQMREASLVVAEVLDVVADAAAPGVSTWELNEIAERRMRKLKADSAFLGYHGYPAVLCTSVNQVVVHGIPRKDVVLRDGDLLSIDFGAYKNGWCGDSARSLGIGRVDAEVQALMDATREALDNAIAQCIPGGRLGDVGWAVQSTVEPRGYAVVRQFVGHGIGRSMHEEPNVPNYGTAGRGLRLLPGLVIAIEPMVTMGSPDVVIEDDGWTAVTNDGSFAAHFEHSVAVTESGPWVLSRA